jgi:hypothetical protein
MSDKIQIFEMDDTEWWIGMGTPEQMRAAFLEEYGDDAYTDAEAMPRPLTDKELDTLRYFTGEEDEQPTKEKTITFREQLAIETAAGVAEPRMFASTEW